MGNSKSKKKPPSANQQTLLQETNENANGLNPEWQTEDPNYSGKKVDKLELVDRYQNEEKSWTQKNHAPTVPSEMQANKCSEKPPGFNIWCQKTVSDGPRPPVGPGKKWKSDTTVLVAVCFI